MNRRAVLLLALLLATLLSSSIAMARAGGGHSYSGGGSRSSSYRSSSSSSSRSSSYRSSGRRSSGGSDDPAVVLGVIIGLLAIAGVVIMAGRARSDRKTEKAVQTNTAQRRSRGRRQASNQIADALLQLGVRDPAFQKSEFLIGAEKAFVEIQHAWSARDFGAASRLMSDGVLRRFTVQTALNEHYGKRNVTADVVVRERRIIAVESDEVFDTLHVEFEASLRDTDVPAATPDAEAFRRASKARVTQFAEVWSFVRRREPGQRHGKLVDGKCPSCGAPALRVPTGACDHCGAILNSGAYDWVLAEITQDGEFDFRPAKEAGGFAALKAADPAVNRQVLEDRANLVFWKWIEARATGDARRFARLCAPEALATVTRLVGGKPSRAFAEAAVGALDLVEVEVVGDRERAHFELRWSTSGAGTGVVTTSVLTLARKAGLKTSAKAGMSTDRCHNCGGVQTKLEAVECDHCGALLPQDWAWEGLVSIDAFRGRKKPAASPRRDELQALIGDFGDPWQRQRALAVMVAVARADGRVSERERDLLDASAKRWQLPAAQLEALLAAPAEELELVKPAGPEEARAFMRALVAAALVDGKVDRTERKVLTATAQHLGFAEDDVRRTIAELSRAA